LHVHERYWKQRTVFLETSDHALLALGHDQETLGPEFGNSGYGALDFVLDDKPKSPVCFGTVRLWNNRDDFKYADVALSG
jgi:hypothetical protein